MVKNLLANAGDVRDTSSIPGLGRFPGKGHGNPLQYSCLENPMDRGAWCTLVHGVEKSRTQVKEISVHTPRPGVGWERGTGACFRCGDMGLAGPFILQCWNRTTINKQQKQTLFQCHLPWEGFLDCNIFHPPLHFSGISYSPSLHTTYFSI